MIIRLRSDIGFCRLELSNDSKILDLKKKIEEVLKVPVEKQKLYLDNNSQIQLNNDMSSLVDSKLENGSMVILKSTVKPERVKKKESNFANADRGENEKANEKNKGASVDKNTVPNNNEKKEPAKNQNNHNKKDWNGNPNDKESGGQANFKSFDSYLLNRGYDTTDLPLNLCFKSVQLTKGTMIKIPLSVTLKHQEYRHVDHLELMNVNEIQEFVNYWYNVNNMFEQRGGWMYGYYKEDKHYPLGIRAVCESIYEPPQYNDDGKVLFMEDPFLKTVDEIAEKLGLERIGWIFTHLPRSEYLTSEEVLHIAKLQLSQMKTTHYTNYKFSNFVTCTISPDPLLSNEPVTNAFMVSDLGMALVRDNLIAETQKDPSHVNLRNPNKNELLPQILEGGKETTRFDTDWLIVRVNESAPKVVRSFFKNTHFSRENRQILQSKIDAQEYFRSGKLNGDSSSSKYSDFHLILFATKVLGHETGFAICDALVNNTPVDPIIEELLTSIEI